MDIESIRSLSHKLYGANLRLEVAAAIADLQDKAICSRAVADHAGLDYNRVQEQVSWFASAGLLLPERDPRSRTKDFIVIKTTFWRSCRELLDELTERDDLT